MSDNFSDLKAAFNPLDMLHPDMLESVDDAARIAEALIVRNTSNDPYWEDAAHAHIKMLILHVVSAQDFGAQERNLMTVRKLLLSGEAEMRQLLEDNGGPGRCCL